MPAAARPIIHPRKRQETRKSLSRTTPESIKWDFLTKAGTLINEENAVGCS